jgi:hypothetical protein
VTEPTCVTRCSRRASRSLLGDFPICGADTGAIDSDWTCTTYDLRGRVTSTVYPSATGVPARTISVNYGTSTGGLTVSRTDSAAPAGSVAPTSTHDLLGRTVTTTDVWQTVTATKYTDYIGRVDSITTTPNKSGSPATMQSFDYDPDGKVTHVYLKIGSAAVVEVAEPHYNTSTRLLESVDYSNGTSLDSITRNAAGATIGTAWDFPDLPDVNHPAVSVYGHDF